MTAHITESDIDRVLDRATPANARAGIDAHLQSCAECARRWEGVLRAHDTLASGRIDVSDELVDRAIAAAKSRASLQAGPARHRWTRWVARAAVVLIAVGVGTGIERVRARGVARPTSTAANVGFLFVFSGTRAALLTADERASIAQSFRAWTDSLTRVGQLVAVGQLTRDAPHLVAATEPNLDSATVRAFASMEGFYVLLARDDEDALALARSCPYLRFGGTIVVRRRAGAGGAARPVATVDANGSVVRTSGALASRTDDPLQ